ncbi:MAG TPA: hypothetical protein VEW26_10455 [Allosphingosinicella sp.]|nr:hypothetical protein [Allosphingosinicella sp.]
MADSARAARHRKADENPPPSGSARHEGLENRAAAAPIKDYSALLAGRDAGPRPVQLKRKHKLRGQKMSLGAFHNMVDEAQRVGEHRAEIDEELDQLAGRGLVSAPAGAGDPMPAAGNAAPIAPQDGLGYDRMMARASDFLSDRHPVRSTANDGGPQFIQQFPQGDVQVTRRVGIDTEPASGHVQRLGPHLNLQTQHDGEIQGGALADPHAAVAEAGALSIAAGGQRHRPTPEERRKFMERRLLSDGHQVRRGGGAAQADDDDQEEDGGDMGFALFD